MVTEKEDKKKKKEDKKDDKKATQISSIYAAAAAPHREPISTAQTMFPAPFRKKPKSTPVLC